MTAILNFQELRPQAAAAVELASQYAFGSTIMYPYIPFDT